MTKEQFYAQLRQFINRQPFAPFVVELRDGRRLVIKQPHVAFDDEGAGFLDSDDGALVDFNHHEVASFGLLEDEAAMSQDEFESQLRQLLHRQPFAPFFVELRDGRRLVIKQPPVVFCDGAASFIDPEDGGLVDFFHDEVQTFGFLEQGAPA